MGSKVRSAFTLVEILIVVIILGILAAIVVPQFTSASEDAQVSNVETQLSTIRNQIELFRVRNNALYPDFIAGFGGGWGDPTATDPLDAGLRGSDYLKADPINPRTRTLAGTQSPSSQSLGTLIVGGEIASPTDLAGVVSGWVWDTGAADRPTEMYAARFNELTREWMDEE